MSVRNHKLNDLVAADPRYAADAYFFVFEALRYAQRRLGKLRKTQTPRSEPAREEHLSGRELLEGVRDLALELYGPMTVAVFQQWGIHATSDFGEIVFNLVRSGDMKATEQDSRADFDDVYKFDQVFCRDYRIEITDLR